MGSERRRVFMSWPINSPLAIISCLQGIPQMPAESPANILRLADIVDRIRPKRVRKPGAASLKNVRSRCLGNIMVVQLPETLLPLNHSVPLRSASCKSLTKSRSAILLASK